MPPPPMPLDLAVPDAAVGNIDIAPQPSDMQAPETRTGVGRASLGTTPLPCDLAAVLSTSCQGCHAREPGAQAPMALTSREDLLGPSVTAPTRKVYELMLERVHNMASPMPPPSSRRLTTQELALIDARVNAQLPAGPIQCDGADADDPSKAAYPPPDPTEIEHCYPLLAHGVGRPGDTTPFRVPTGESHACFIFDVPWPGEAQALTIRSHQGPVVHHWLLSDQTSDVTDGQVLPDRPDCNFGAQKIYGVSAVNQQAALNMPPGVGLQMPKGNSGVRLMLGMHYYNLGEPIDDSSGAEVCLARTPREQTATITELGVSFIVLPPHRTADFASTCKPNFSGDIHILRSFPHMHARGVKLDTIIERAGGLREPLIDVPFDFNNQIAYDRTAVIAPGDRLVTTCHFDNQTNFTIFGGESTDQEMCINFVTAWPADALTTSRNAAGGDACAE